MTLYMLFAGLGILIYAGAALAETAIAAVSDAHIAFGFQIAVGEESFTSADRSPSAVIDGESQALAAGMRLFQERGCGGCHRPDSTGVGPALHGLFGSPVQDPTCGVAIVDESYLREAILNPSATVAAGFLPLMPTFAGELTEDELQALIVYVKSLSVPVQEQRE